MSTRQATRDWTTRHARPPPCMQNKRKRTLRRGKEVFRKAVKKAIGRVVRKTRSYLQSIEEELDGKDNEDFDDQRHSSHLSVNSIFAKLLREKSAAQRPWYTWGVLQGVRLAKAVGIDRISVIEFGVAGATVFSRWSRLLTRSGISVEWRSIPTVSILAAASRSRWIIVTVQTCSHRDAIRWMRTSSATICVGHGLCWA